MVEKASNLGVQIQQQHLELANQQSVDCPLWSQSVQHEYVYGFGEPEFRCLN